VGAHIIWQYFCMTRDASGDQYAGVARALSTEHGIVATLENAIATALRIVDRCDHAGISLVVKGSVVDTVTASDSTVERAYELQTKTGEGPCLQTLREHETVYSPDLRSEERWPLWSHKVVEELGVCSVLSLQLFVGSKTFGSLDLFSNTPDAFRLDDRVSALALAAHVAVAMTAAQDRQGMESALLTRTVIGQAEGRLIERLGLTPDQAFAALVRASQTTNTRLTDVAAEIVENGVRIELFG
jgi:transcriptional regulator with GAF, ATPase, and Fis domain